MSAERHRLEEEVRRHLDGELDAAGEQRLEEALRRDPEAAAELEALDLLVEAVGSLPAEVLPDRSLWPAIAERLEEERRLDEAAAPAGPGGAGRGAGSWAVAAALAATLAGAFLLGRFTLPEPVPSSAPPAAVARTTEGPRRAALPPDVARAAGALLETRDELRRTFEARRDELPPATRALVESNLRTIEEAILQIEAALTEHPEDRELGRILVAYRSREIALLEQAQRAAGRL